MSYNPQKDEEEKKQKEDESIKRQRRLFRDDEVKRIDLDLVGERFGLIVNAVFAYIFYANA